MGYSIFVCMSNTVLRTTNTQLNALKHVYPLQNWIWDALKSVSISYVAPILWKLIIFEEWQFDVTKQFTCAWTGSSLYDDCCCDFFVFLPAYRNICIHEWVKRTHLLSKLMIAAKQECHKRIVIWCDKAIYTGVNHSTTMIIVVVTFLYTC